MRIRYLPGQPAHDVAAPTQAVSRTGIEGLDYVLGGGLTPHRFYLVEGVPGSGKTTLAMQFLHEGAERGEKVLYITLSETEAELREVARSHGWSLKGVSLAEVIPAESSLDPEQQYTVFHPSEVELNETTRRILAEIERVEPDRVVFDSLSELRLLASSPLRYRRQILALKQFFAGRKCTVLILDDRTATENDLQVHSITHGVILLEQLYPEYGAERRRLRVVKFRGRAFRGGYHDFVIRRGGLSVFPRLVAAEHRQPAHRKLKSTGVQEFDALLGGGIESGTSVLISGGPGSGKSTLAAQIALAAAQRGEKAALFLFDEAPGTLLLRVKSLGVDIEPFVEQGLITLYQVDPAELSPGEFGVRVRAAAEQENAAVIVVDSLNGYLYAMPEERFLTIQLHELMSFLGQIGVITVLVGVHGMLGADASAPADASYLADAVVLLRYFESAGEIRQAISIMKKRGGYHERTIREFRLEPGRIRIGEPLRDFQGVLTGVPSYIGASGPLMQNASPADG